MISDSSDQPTSEAWSEPSRTSKMELFAKIVNGFQLLTIFAKNSISEVCVDSEYASMIVAEAYLRACQTSVVKYIFIIHVNPLTPGVH